MEIRVKLMGSLKAKAPSGDRLDLGEESTVDDALRALDIPGTGVQIVIVNGKPQGDRTHPLSPNDELTILPPVGGG